MLTSVSKSKEYSMSEPTRSQIVKAIKQVGDAVDSLTVIVDNITVLAQAQAVVIKDIHDELADQARQIDRIEGLCDELDNRL
tara:strand:+ start:674 stop:919 length:246 start_codon:yes stop_codon:yes gene_type:complete